MVTQRASILIAVSAMHVVLAAAMLQQHRTAAAVADQAIEVTLLTETPRPVRSVEVPVALQSPVVDIAVPDIQIAVTAPAVLTTHPLAPPTVAALNAGPGTGPALRVITAADYLRSPMARYPPVARQLRQQGVVLVRVTIGVTGEPLQVEIERSSGFRLLDAAALDAVRKAWFRPQLESGSARVVSALVPVDFSIASARLASR